MKTTCYCIYCPKHPLHAQRKELEILTGYEVGDYIYGKFSASGVAVECLVPASSAFDELDITPSYHEFPVTAYGDGCSVTGFETNSYTIRAYCSNEEYKND